VKRELEPAKVESENLVSYIDPYYAEVLELVFDGINPVSCKTFAEKYSLNNKGANPKRLVIGLHLKEEDIEKYFGPLINRNGYRYSHIEDEELIREVEHLWMVTHQRVGVPNNRQINKSEARGYVYQKLKGDKAMN